MSTGIGCLVLPLLQNHIQYRKVLKLVLITIIFYVAAKWMQTYPLLISE